MDAAPPSPPPLRPPPAPGSFATATPPAPESARRDVAHAAAGAEHVGDRAAARVPGPSAPSTLRMPFDWTAFATAAARAALRSRDLLGRLLLLLGVLLLLGLLLGDRLRLLLLGLLRRLREALGDEDLRVAVGDLLERDLLRQVGVRERDVGAGVEDERDREHGHEQPVHALEVGALRLLRQGGLRRPRRAAPRTARAASRRRARSCRAGRRSPGREQVCPASARAPARRARRSRRRPAAPGSAPPTPSSKWSA